jgi:hypothetical protein
VVFDVNGCVPLCSVLSYDHALAGNDYRNTSANPIIHRPDTSTKAIPMASHPDTTRILYRLKTSEDFEWHVFAHELDSLTARHIALQLKGVGIEALVCPSDEFEDKGLPLTYRAQEYF